MKTDYDQITWNLLHPNFPQMVGDRRCPNYKSYIKAEKERSIDPEFCANLLDELADNCEKITFTTFKYKNEYGAECQAIYDKGGRGRPVELVGIEGIETDREVSDTLHNRTYKAVEKYCKELTQSSPLPQQESNNPSHMDTLVDQENENGDSPQKNKFNDLPDSKLPVINSKIIDPKWILEIYLNNAFECSIDAFYAWLVYGKVHKEKLTWIFKKNKSAVISKAQLKMFINKITGNEADTKEAYFNKVFGITIKTNDYKNAKLDPYFKELSTKIEKNKLGVK